MSPDFRFLAVYMRTYSTVCTEDTYFGVEESLLADYFLPGPRWRAAKGFSYRTGAGATPGLRWRAARGFSYRTGAGATPGLSSSLLLRHQGATWLFRQRQYFQTPTVFLNTDSIFKHRQYFLTPTVFINTDSIFKHRQYF